MPRALRRELIERELRESPHRTNYQIAQYCDCDPKVVSAIRGHIIRERRARKEEKAAGTFGAASNVRAVAITEQERAKYERKD